MDLKCLGKVIGINRLPRRRSTRSNFSGHIIVPASPDFITETFEMTRNGNNIAASYMGRARSLVLADDVAGILASSASR